MFRSVRTRIIVTFLIAILVISGFVAFSVFQYIHWNEERIADERGVRAAQTCAVIFEAIDERGVDLSDPVEYERYHQILRNLCVQTGMEYLYAYQCNVEDGTATYLMSVGEDDEQDAYFQQMRGYGTVVEKQFTDIELRTLQGEVVEGPIEYDNEFGHMLDWVAPVEGWDGNVIAASSYSVDIQRASVWRNALLAFMPIVLVVLMILAVQLYVMWRYIFAPLRTIAQRMRTFSAEDAASFEPLGISSNDEMREISDAFAQMAGEIADYTASIESLTAERLQAGVQLDIARRIQLGMVPQRTEVEGDGFKAVAFSRAARSVGGDFYDVVKLDSGEIAVTVGDVSGKGIAAALFMAMVKTLVREGLLAEFEPAVVLNRVNERLCQENPEGMFVTMFAYVFDPASGSVRYANAGHVPPLVVDHDVKRLAVAHGMLLGVFESARVAEGEFQLEPGQSMLVFTDGATEAIDVNEAFLGEEAFSNCLEADAPYADAGGLVDAAVGAVDDFAIGQEQFDDLTMVALTRFGYSQ